MECPSCHGKWSSDSTIPRILSCGHTFCEGCLKEKFRLNKIRCSECKQNHVFQIDRDFSDTDSEYKEKCIASLSKNFSLLSIISDSLVGKIEEIDIQICDEHDLPIHSFTEKPQSELCDRCIEEVREMGLIIKPLPHVEEYFNNLIVKISENLKNKKEKAESISNVSALNEKTEIKKAENIVNQFFQKILYAVDWTQNDTLESLKKVIQDLNVNNQEPKNHAEQLKVLLEDLNNQINYLRVLNDQDLVRNSEFLESLLSRSFTKPAKPIKKLVLTSSKAKMAKFKDLLQKNLKIEINKKSENWTCLNCNSLSKEGQVLCSKCQAFRPVQSYQSLKNQLPVITEQESKELNLRREIELDQITKLEKSDPSGMFYIIHSNWVSSWKLFVFDKSTDKPGYLPPGQINNYCLFDNEECTILKKGLLPMIDYKLVTEDIWNRFLLVYGGGPPIKRNQQNIYMSKLK